SNNYWGKNSSHTATITPTKETFSHTEGEKAEKEVEEKEPDVTNVKKEHVVEDVEMEPVQKPKDTKSSTRIQLTDIILEIPIPHPESPQAALKPDNGKRIAEDTKASPKKLVIVSTKKKNKVVKEILTSLSKRYERLTKIPGELRISSALPAPIQIPSQSGRLRKATDLEPEICIAVLECNRSFLERVLFINNIVIEEPSMGYSSLMLLRKKHFRE
nr:hypothetical protein [Tanacetum cinerariifolium]